MTLLNESEPKLKTSVFTVSEKNVVEGNLKSIKTISAGLKEIRIIKHLSREWLRFSSSQFVELRHFVGVSQSYKYLFEMVLFYPAKLSHFISRLSRIVDGSKRVSLG